MKSNNYAGWVIGIICIIVILSILIPDLLKSKKELDESKREYEMLNNDKYISDSDCVKEFAECIKNKDMDSAKKLLSSNCSFYNTSKCYSIESCFENLDEYETYRYEKRGNDVKNEVTYRIYWNGWNESEASQIITLILEKNVGKEEIIYKIKTITLNEN